jgi:hypothetical protein
MAVKIFVSYSRKDALQMRGGSGVARRLKGVVSRTDEGSGVVKVKAGMRS